MEHEEAKAILELCRPGIFEDREDPMLAEALELIESDPKLKEWFDQQQAIDHQIASALNEIEPPADLKGSILAGMRAHAVKSKEEPTTSNNASFSETPVTTSPSFWRQPWVGIAAAVALLLVVIVVPKEKQADSEYSINHAGIVSELPATIQFLAKEIDGFKFRRFDKKSKKPEALMSYLASLDTPSPALLPKPVGGVPSLGCYSLDFNGAKMGMICFKEKQLMHLATIRKNECLDEFPKGTSVYESSKHDQAFKVWHDGEKIYILSIHGKKEELPVLI